MNSIVLVLLMACALGVVLLARKESLNGGGSKPKAGKAAGASKKKAAGKPKRATGDVEILPPSEAPENPFQRPPRVIVIDLPPLRPAR